MSKSKKRIQRKVDINGKRVSVYGFSVAEINRKIAELSQKVEMSKNFSKVADRWSSEHFEEVEYYTVQCYRKPLRDVTEEFGEYNIKEITPLDIENYIKRFAAKGYAKQTIKLRLIVLRQIFDYAVIHYGLKINPTQAVTVPKKAKTSKRKMPEEKIIDIIKQSYRKPFGLFAYLLLYTGCRREEALALRYEDIDREKKEISIHSVVIFEGGKSVVRPYTKSEAGTRKILLPDILANVLLNYKHGFIFNAGDMERQLGPRQFYNLWNSYCKASDLTYTDEELKVHNLVTPHQLRHAYASFLHEADVDVKDAQHLMGHSKIETTQDIYTEIREKRKKETSVRINDFFTQDRHIS